MWPESNFILKRRLTIVSQHIVWLQREPWSGIWDLRMYRGVVYIFRCLFACVRFLLSTIIVLPRQVNGLSTPRRGEGNMESSEETTVAAAPQVKIGPDGNVILDEQR